MRPEPTPHQPPREPAPRKGAEPLPSARGDAQSGAEPAPDPGGAARVPAGLEPEGVAQVVEGGVGGRAAGLSEPAHSGRDGGTEGAGRRAGRAARRVAALALAEAEEAAAFRLAPVGPDATGSYGEHPDQAVDFYRPRSPRDAGRPAPLVALFHGGAWRARYDRAHLSPLAAHLAAHGFAVASVEYRRGGPEEPPQHASDVPPAGRWPETFDDVAAAVDALPALAVRTLGADTVDPRRFVLSGHSAGGHLALWAAARHVLPPDSPWHRASPPPLRGVVALAPIADLTSAIRLRVCSDAVRQLLGAPAHLEARLPHADPSALLPSGIATTIVHGTSDNEVPPEVSEAFARAAASAGEEVTTAWLPATSHFALITPHTQASATVLAELSQLAW